MVHALQHAQTALVQPSSPDDFEALTSATLTQAA